MCKLPSGIIVQRKFLVDPLVRLSPSLHGHDTGAHHEIVDLLHTLRSLELGSCTCDIPHKPGVARDKVAYWPPNIRGLAIFVRRQRETIKHSSTRCFVASNNIYIQVSIEGCRESSSNASADAGRAAYDDGDRRCGSTWARIIGCVEGPSISDRGHNCIVVRGRDRGLDGGVCLKYGALGLRR
jgi:hypothetical protein